MWTRTLSMCISTRPGMPRLSHRIGGQAPQPSPGTDEPHQEAHREPERKPADVGEERDAAVRGGRAEGRDAVQELEREPEAEHDDRRHLEQLVEEPEED